MFATPPIPVSAGTPGANARERERPVPERLREQGRTAAFSDRKTL